MSVLMLSVFLALAPAESRSAGRHVQRVATRGGTMMVRNFLADPDVVAVNPITRGGTESANYYVLGSRPYEIVESTTPAKIALPDPVEKGYQIDFFPSEGTFSIFVYKQPIGAMRRTAAADLSMRLGISSANLCRVIAIVWVSPLADKSGAYSGRDVGFPNCPGAYVLPGGN